MAESLWVERYRPTEVDDYVYMDENQHKQIKQWIAGEDIPHILLSGSAGVGKTTLAKLLIHQLGVQRSDTLFLNASRDRGIETIRSKITNFASTMSFGHMKIVLMDEADYVTPDAQASLRGVMEEYSENCRFIFTCNYPNKIIPAIHSRCHVMHINKLDRDVFTERAAVVLVEEGVMFELEILDLFVTATYPDMRKCLNSLQEHSRSGELLSPAASSVSSSEEYLVKAVESFRAGNIKAGREAIINNATSADVEEIIRWCYDNLELWSDNQDGQDQAVRIIRDGLVNHSLVGDPEINLAAMMVELTTI